MAIRVSLFPETSDDLRLLLVNTVASSIERGRAAKGRELSPFWSGVVSFLTPGYDTYMSESVCKCRLQHCRNTVVFVDELKVTHDL